MAQVAHREQAEFQVRADSVVTVAPVVHQEYQELLVQVVPVVRQASVAIVVRQEHQEFQELPVPVERRAWSEATARHLRAN